MKKLITLALLSPLATFAQPDNNRTWEIGINAGVASNPANPDGINSSYIFNTSKDINPSATISVRKSIKHFQIGLEVSPTQIQYHYKTYDYNSNSHTEYANYRVVMANPALPINLTGNYIIRLSNSYLYAGVASGYCVNTLKYDKRFGDIFTKPKNSVDIGAQVGYEYYLSKRFSLNAEIVYRLILCKAEYYVPNPLYYYSATLGLRIRV